MIDIEIRDGGGVRILSGRLTDHMRTDESMIFDGLAVAHALRLVHISKGVSVTTGYTGSWALGIAGNGLKGLRAYASPSGFESNGIPFDRDEYRQTTTAFTDELREQPQAVARRLVWPLLRGLGLRKKYGYELSSASD